MSKNAVRAKGTKNTTGRYDGGYVDVFLVEESLLKGLSVLAKYRDSVAAVKLTIQVLLPICIMVYLTMSEVNSRFVVVFIKCNSLEIRS